MVNISDETAAINYLLDGSVSVKNDLDQVRFLFQVRLEARCRSVRMECQDLTAYMGKRIELYGYRMVNLITLLATFVTNITSECLVCRMAATFWANVVCS